MALLFKVLFIIGFYHIFYYIGILYLYRKLYKKGTFKTYVLYCFKKQYKVYHLYDFCGIFCCLIGLVYLDIYFFKQTPYYKIY
jgi:hypothetical protein